MFTLNDDWEIRNMVGEVEGFSLESLTDDNAQLLTMLETKKVFNEQYFSDMKKLIEVSKLVGLEGMNITLASLLDEMIPGFITDTMPISAFTKDPTPVQKQYTFKMITDFSRQALYNQKYRVNSA
jgi:hypothetical protein